ncbi:MAG: hypothetical protein A3F54_04435 [Candidatus Kerfeldbacteria bacterium RIFCSPHIGHO2_12_FULL_48_17]|uniref:Uncharacterized protein n=1 Tax=Candidatus Kerfeldbacteria bacterium RIFCSPHIGHO2_12_FULL_48_17 TaxID=1798542 RepID=A0A1G2B327_9BACT|nr:MAG: hypothetical protein A3F54_04435 [Candidatus Kerfeldbacteria bacterium RIFCSPHIGHO2_12_FULL_48_17]
MAPSKQNKPGTTGKKNKKTRPFKTWQDMKPGPERDAAQKRAEQVAVDIDEPFWLEYQENAA